MGLKFTQGAGNLAFIILYLAAGVHPLLRNIENRQKASWGCYTTTPINLLVCNIIISSDLTTTNRIQVDEPFLVNIPVSQM